MGARGLHLRPLIVVAGGTERFLRFDEQRGVSTRMRLVTGVTILGLEGRSSFFQIFFVPLLGAALVLVTMRAARYLDPRAVLPAGLLAAGAVLGAVLGEGEADEILAVDSALERLAEVSAVLRRLSPRDRRVAAETIRYAHVAS